MSDSFAVVSFPDSAWNQAMKALAKTATHHLPQDWYRKIALRAPPPAGFGGVEMIEAECRAVLAAKAFRAARLGEIKAQAGSVWDAIQPVQDVLGPMRSASKAMIDAAIEDLTCGVFQLKMDFNRGRPHQCCNLQIEPLFNDQRDPNYPGHPSYPSGHASQAFTTALLYAHLFPRLEESLLTAARRVARNREIGGMHFPSDTDAGEDLSTQFVGMLVRCGSFEPLMNAVRAEWPEFA